MVQEVREYLQYLENTNCKVILRNITKAQAMQSTTTKFPILSNRFGQTQSHLSTIIITTAITNSHVGVTASVNHFQVQNKKPL